MTETADVPRSDLDGTTLPEALEDQLFEVWLQDDRSAALTGLEQLCSLHADQAAALRQLAKKLDRADSTIGFDEELQPDHIDRYEILRCIGRGEPLGSMASDLAPARCMPVGCKAKRFLLHRERDEDSLGRMHRVLRGHESRSMVFCMSYTPNGRRLACFDGANHAMRIFDTELGSQLLELYDHSGWVRTLTFDAEGARLFALMDTGPLAWGVYDWRAAGR